MEFQKLIEKRRSVRKYSAGHTIPKEDILEMIRAAQEAPSWKNSQTGRYYCLLSEEMTQQFRTDCLPSGNALKSENAALIVTTFVHNRSGFKQDGTADNELENGWGCYDLGLHNQNILLKATELGLGSLVMGIRDIDKIKGLLDISKEEIIVSVIAIGISDIEPERPKRKTVEDITRFY